MSDSTKIVPLAKLCDVFTDGNWVQTKDQSPAGIRLVQTGNIGTGAFKNRLSKARFISEATFRDLRCTEVFPGDCLVSRLPDPVGRACIIPDLGERMITAVDCSILRLDRSRILPEYFGYYAQSATYFNEVERYCSGATRKRISRKNLGKVGVPVPALSQQERIVAILDEAFVGIEASIANTDKNLANARELFNSYLDQNVAPCESQAIRMGDHFETVTGNTPPKKDSENWGGFMPLVKPPELRDGCISDAADSLSEKGAAKARVAPKDAVLVSCIGNLGKVALTEVPVAFNQQINAIFPKPDIMLPEFLFFQTLTTQFKRQLHSVASGTTVSIVNKSKFNELRLYAPALSEQKRIVDELQTISHDTQALCVLIQKKLDSLGELRQSLLQIALSGELTADRAEREMLEQPA